MTALASVALLSLVTDRIAATQIADDTSGLSPTSSKVVDVFVTREVEKRSKLLVTGLDKLAELTKAYNDINKPDIKSFATVDAQTPNTAFSDKRKNEVAAAKKKLDKLTAAVDAAILASGEKAAEAYSKLEKSLSGNSKDEDE